MLAARVSIPTSRASVVARAGKTASNKTASNKAGASAAASRLEEAQEYLVNMPGISAPFPNVFDPAGFTKFITVKDLKRYRESEITHGRVAMLAALGFVVGEQLEDFPALLNFDGGISGVPAIYQFQAVQQVRPGFWESLVLFIGLAEVYRVAFGWASPKGEGFNALKEDYEPGELDFDPLGLLPSDPEEKKILQTKELNNGRLAMIGIAGFVAQELVVNQEIFEHLILRFEDELIDEFDTIALEVDEAVGAKVLPIIPEIPIPGRK